MYKVTIGMILLLSSAFAVAETYWLIGSFPDRTSAMAEAERISAELGDEVFLHSGGKRYRILTEVPNNEADRRDMRQQLQAAGVGNIFVLNYGDNVPSLDPVFAVKTESMEESYDDMDMADEDMSMGDDLDEADLAEIDAMLDDYDDDLFGEGNYAVVASFSSQDNADAMSADLDVSGYDVIVRSAMVNGTEYFRVLVGPVTEDAEADLLGRLIDMGHRGAWILRGVTGASSYLLDFDDYDDFDDETVVIRQQELPESVRNRNQPRAYPGEDSDFNLARLKD